MAHHIDAKKELEKYKSQITDENDFAGKTRYVADGLAGKKTGPIAKIWDKVQKLWQVVRSDKVPWYHKIVPLAALVYLVSPIDAIPDYIPVVGLLDDAAVLMLAFKSLGELIRTATDSAIDGASSYAKRKGEQALEEINARAQRNLAISAALNGAMLLCASLVAIFIPVMKTAGILVASIINYVILVRAFCNILRFVRTVLMPYRDLVRFVLPVFAAAIREQKSLEAALRISINAVVEYFYKDKVPRPAQIAHKIAAHYGLVKTRSEIGTYAADVFYPLVCRFLRTILLNIVLFTVCFGALVFIAKYFLFRHALGMGILDLWAYPVTFIIKLIQGAA